HPAGGKSRRRQYPAAGTRPLAAWQKRFGQCRLCRRPRRDASAGHPDRKQLLPDRLALAEEEPVSLLHRPRSDEWLLTGKALDRIDEPTFVHAELFLKERKS